MRTDICSIFIASFVCGCSAFSSGTKDTRYAAFAASSTIPGEASDTLNVTALVNRQARTIPILNPTDNAIRGAKVWANGNFVPPLDNLPSHGIVTLRRDEFYDASVIPLSKSETAATTVQLAESRKLHNLLGPVFV